MNQSNRGKAVIAGIFLLALALSGYAWWHQFRQSWRCREFLGTETVQLVKLAPRVTLLRLKVDTTAADQKAATETLRIAETEILVAEAVEITGVPGLVHARHALLQDMNYRWDDVRSECVSQWSFALRFEREGQVTTLGFDPHCNRIGLVGTTRWVPFLPELMSTFVKKSDEWESRANSR